MDLPWGDERTEKFITNVGLVTSDGPFGSNVMAVEWTHHISYKPGLIAISLGPNKATVQNIRESKEFGVNICSVDQSVLASVSGGYSAKEFDKIGALKELGFKFYKAKKIKPLLIEGAAMNAECKLIKEISLGDHIMFFGEVVQATASTMEPLAYFNGKYWKMTQTLQKPSDEERAKIRAVVEKYKKNV